ncbi:MAG: family transporter [Nevskia sp.]|nr:family transporter [Nevskia sp.]
MNAPSSPPAVPAQTPPLTPLQSFRENWGWFATAGVTLLMLYFLGPIMTPFVVGGVLAYLGNPVCDRLEHHGVPRALSVGLVFLVFFAVLITALVLVLPMLQDQIVQMTQNIPDWLKWLQDVGLPKLRIRLPAGIRLDAAGLRSALTQNWSQAGDIASTVLARIGRSTPALLGFAANLLLIPIVTFYLMRDWELMLKRVDQLIPPRLRGHTEEFAREIDSVLSALIRGQLLVMAALALIYSIGLWLTGLKVALLIGLVAGLVSFIPYLGFATGFLLAIVTTLVQDQELFALLPVTVVFGIGILLENAVLTPLLVGNRIGLHPVAVIFALLAGGQLLGFSGVLVALPVAAIFAVGARHARKRWLRSPLYWGRGAPPPPDDVAPPGSPAL